MTPDEFLKAMIEQVQKSEKSQDPEVRVMIELMQAVANSGDEELKANYVTELKKNFAQALGQIQSSQSGDTALREPEQKPVLPLPPDEAYPIGKKANSTWETTKAIFNLIRQEYPKYKEYATRGIFAGAIFLVVVTIISLFLSWDTFAKSLIDNNSSGHPTGLFHFLHIERVIVCVMYFQWLIILVAVSTFFIIYMGNETETLRYYCKMFGVEALILFTFWILIFGPYSLMFMNFWIALQGILNFLGWCAIWGLIAYYIFQRAKVGDEAKLYFATFGIELIINTVRLYFIFIVLYIPIFIGVVIYIAYNNSDKSWANVPYEVAGFWGWWIPAILGSINLAMSLGIFFGWNAPVSGIKLSFDSRDMTSEEKDFMIGFYRRLVEAGRGDEQVFKSWNVIESSGVFAFTYGANIFISRGAFTERYFNALVAHEIGHLHQRDGLILQALHSFTYPLFNHLLFNPTTIQKGVIEQDKDFNKPNSLLSGIISSMTITFFTLIFGGWSVQALARFWSKFYINRDYMADDYAVSLGFAGELLNYLDSYKDFDTALPLFNRWRGYTRVRIERIRVKIEMSY